MESRIPAVRNFQIRVFKHVARIVRRNHFLLFFPTYALQRKREKKIKSFSPLVTYEIMLRAFFCLPLRAGNMVVSKGHREARQRFSLIATTNIHVIKIKGVAAAVKWPFRKGEGGDTAAVSLGLWETESPKSLSGLAWGEIGQRFLLHTVYLLRFSFILPRGKPLCVKVLLFLLPPRNCGSLISPSQEGRGGKGKKSQRLLFFSAVVGWRPKIRQFSDAQSSFSS